MKLEIVQDWAFSVAGPELWNSLPDELRLSKSLNSFKRLLKTHLFTRAYNLWYHCILHIFKIYCYAAKMSASSWYTSYLFGKHLMNHPKLSCFHIQCYECGFGITERNRMLFCQKCANYTCSSCHAYNKETYPCCERQTLEYITWIIT